MVRLVYFKFLKNIVDGCKLFKCKFFIKRAKVVLFRKIFKDIMIWCLVDYRGEIDEYSKKFKKTVR